MTQYAQQISNGVRITFKAGKGLSGLDAGGRADGSCCGPQHGDVSPLPDRYLARRRRTRRSDSPSTRSSRDHNAGCVVVEENTATSRSWRATSSRASPIGRSAIPAATRAAATAIREAVDATHANGHRRGRLGGGTPPPNSASCTSVSSPTPTATPSVYRRVRQTLPTQNCLHRPAAN